MALASGPSSSVVWIYARLEESHLSGSTGLRSTGILASLWAGARLRLLTLTSVPNLHQSLALCRHSVVTHVHTNGCTDAQSPP